MIREGLPGTPEGRCGVGGPSPGLRGTRTRIFGADGHLARRVAWWLRCWADRMAPGTAFRNMSGLAVTLEGEGPGTGWRLNTDGRGIPVWYYTPDYHKGWDDRLGANFVKLQTRVDNDVLIHEWNVAPGEITELGSPAKRYRIVMGQATELEYDEGMWLVNYPGLAFAQRLTPEQMIERGHLVELP